jgi:hypothetical protein
MPATFFSAIHCMYTLLNFRSLVMIIMTIMIIILRMTATKSAAAAAPAAKYLVVDIRLYMSMDVSVKFDLYVLLLFVCFLF